MRNLALRSTAGKRLIPELKSSSLDSLSIRNSTRSFLTIMHDLNRFHLSF